MLIAAIVTLLIVATLATGLRAGRRGDMIERHPYNNRHNDASAARQDRVDLEPRWRWR